MMMADEKSSGDTVHADHKTAMDKASVDLNATAEEDKDNKDNKVNKDNKDNKAAVHPPTDTRVVTWNATLGADVERLGALGAMVDPVTSVIRSILLPGQPHFLGAASDHVETFIPAALHKRWSPPVTCVTVVSRTESAGGGVLSVTLHTAQAKQLQFGVATTAADASGVDRVCLCGRQLEEIQFCFDEHSRLVDIRTRWST